MSKILLFARACALACACVRDKDTGVRARVYVCARVCFVSRETRIPHCKCRCTPFAKNNIGDVEPPEYGI